MGRVKNMNPLIRLCGQKRSHRLRDLNGGVESVIRYGPREVGVN